MLFVEAHSIRFEDGVEGAGVDHDARLELRVDQVVVDGHLKGASGTQLAANLREDEEAAEGVHQLVLLHLLEEVGDCDAHRAENRVSKHEQEAVHEENDLADVGDEELLWGREVLFSCD